MQSLFNPVRIPGIKTSVTASSPFAKPVGNWIGDSQLWGVTRFECQRATLGYSVLNNHLRKGYGLEIAKATIEYGFDTLQLNRIEAEILPQNKSSITLCKKAGMQSEGIRRQALKIGSQFKVPPIATIKQQQISSRFSQTPHLMNADRFKVQTTSKRNERTSLQGSGNLHKFK